MTQQKSYIDNFIEAIDTAGKTWAVAIVGLAMLVTGPVIAATFRTPPGVAVISLGSILLYLAFASVRRRTKEGKK